MCGIWCRISEGNGVQKGSSCCLCDPSNKLFDQQHGFVSRRGPDLTRSRCFDVKSIKKNSCENPSTADTAASRVSRDTQPGWVHMISHVLWTQGEDIVPQPYTNLEETKFMLFNGDIFSFNGCTDGGEPDASCGANEDKSKNDGITLFNLFEVCGDAVEICRILENLQGPFAFIYVDLSKDLICWARDFFGRESLLFSNELDLQNEANTAWNFSSVSVFSNAIEVPTSGLFCVELGSKALTVYPYSHARSSVSELQSEFISVLKMSGFISSASVCSQSSISLHFSSRLKLPDTEEEHANLVLAELINIANTSSSAEIFISKAADSLRESIDLFEKYLKNSVKRRVSTLPPYCKNCIIQRRNNPQVLVNCNHSRVGVLFSGGLDSAVVAYLAADTLPEGSTLDLLNVAFSKDDNFHNIPDRETAIASYRMLRERFEPQGKSINLVLVNVGKPEVEETRREIIRHLIYPLRSVIDDSVGVCLWFAARGHGEIYNSTKKNLYKSPVRTLLLGSGADELLGGYSRHRSAYEQSGWLRLASEMQFDVDRISIRNLGRDNRIVSDHGVCPRLPFLDENVVDFLARQCDVWVKCCPVNAGPLGSRGSGEKLLLRALGAKLFGDHYLSLALFPKRAMQFGSRIAKLENSKEKGGDSCQRLL